MLGVGWLLVLWLGNAQLRCLILKLFRCHGGGEARCRHVQRTCSRSSCMPECLVGIYHPHGIRCGYNLGRRPSYNILGSVRDLASKRGELNFPGGGVMPHTAGQLQRNLRVLLPLPQGNCSVSQMSAG